MGAPAVPPLCRETQSLGQQMLNAPVGINGLTKPLEFIGGTVGEECILGIYCTYISIHIYVYIYTYIGVYIEVPFVIYIYKNIYYV